MRSTPSPMSRVGGLRVIPKMFVTLLMLIAASGYGSPQTYVWEAEQPAKMVLKDHVWRYIHGGRDIDIKKIVSGEQPVSFEPIPHNHYVAPDQPNQAAVLKIEILNPTDTIQLRTLMVQANGSQTLEIYTRPPSGDVRQYWMGLASTNMSFFPRAQIVLQPGLNTVFINSPVFNYLPLWIGTDVQMDRLVERQIFFISSLFGASLVMTLGAGLVVLLFRDPLMFWYWIYAMSTSLMFFLQPNMPVLFDTNIFRIFDMNYAHVMNLSIIIELIATLSFISQYLTLKTYSPKVHKMATGYTIVMCLIVATVPVGFDVFRWIVMSYIVFITGLFIYSMFKGNPNAKKGAFSWGFYVMGLVFITAFQSENLLLGLNLGWTCFLVEMVMFGFLSLYKIYRKTLVMDQEKQHSFSQLKKLVYPSQLLQMRKGSLLEETMPIGKGCGAVLCLDIENSSKIDHEKNHLFFKEFLLKSQLLMSEGIDFKGERCQGFRIKEMGDGFLCSFGFPFEVSQNEAGKVALEFALHFEQILNDCADKYLSVDVSCGIGISLGEIGGFFPNAGIQQYDLYGKPLIKATRFQAMRKTIKADFSLAGSLFVIEKAVYDQLPNNMQNEFRRIDPRGLSRSIRDHDPKEAIYIKSSYHRVVKRVV
ncbi:adenylate/guanylate cyclase domain-containing protein [Pseudobacteriovorax antillogorgiicola]|uniref:Adenylate cyclase, class 3 n=1 Tax=Pseudobacteriovorax antillogorgiicola TaxID=1513793 RepID=A0A1Y6BBD7_9BACT|nr:adenylate/guanylate cyclase domain-containing protein [Pseudobacteriovorax antillogorgiicola]TCS57317.1 class 3 adenylate cyclase [Pseudobacteriovorax antillogorgiicola]SMF02601.1 Adenylate cyclase, class 3 [Pseudobacteriovorax antillogorgiicola]